MTPRRTDKPRVGFFGLLGQGNLGNDGSLEVMLSFLQNRHPGAEIDFLVSGPDEVTRRYGRPAIRMHWNKHEYETSSGARALMLKAVGKLVDAVRTAAWVRRHDVVIVPGMGVLETTLPLRPWGFPYSLFLLCASGRLLGARVALVSVGASSIASRSTRWLVSRATRYAAYRSYRDRLSRDAIAAMGVDTARDPLCPDLVFAMPTPDIAATQTAGVVGLGVMDYSGSNEDRHEAEQIHAEYVKRVVRFAVWLVDYGYTVRLFTGDRADEQVAFAVEKAVRQQRPANHDEMITTEPTTSLSELMGRMSHVDTVVATRFHNIVCSLKLAKPTISLGYGEKNDVLMKSVGLGAFCQHVRHLDVDLLIEQFTELQDRRSEFVDSMLEQAAVNAALLENQFAVLSRIIRKTPW